jgi:hypothetical protein
MSKNSIQNEDAGWRNNVKEDGVMNSGSRVMFVTNAGEGVGLL